MAARSLKTTLMRRIVFVAAMCFAVATVILLTGIRQSERDHDRAVAETIARQLEFQLVRIGADFDDVTRFPDWDPALDAVARGGQCIRFLDPDGVPLKSHCIGAPGLAAPAWFAALYRTFLPEGGPALRAVFEKDRLRGTVIVSSDLSTEITNVWQGLKPMLILTALIVTSLCALVYIVVDRALAPTRQITEGLNRIAGGDFTTRLAAFPTAEMHRIGEVTNQMTARLQTALDERAELMHRLMTAQETERKTLARDLHDEFAQNLTAISALAAALAKSAPDAPEAETLTRLTARTMTALRQTLLHLRPADLDRLGLAESLRQLVAMWEAASLPGQTFSCDVEDFDKAGAGGRDARSAAHLYRIAQEALTNAARHAGATRIQLTLTEDSLSIEDNGSGLASSKAGYGLRNIEERTAALGATLALTEPPGGGLRLTVTLPQAQAKAA